MRIATRGRRRSRPLGTLASRLSRDQRGVELVELTLVLPVLFVIVFGLLEFGAVFDVEHQVSGLTREGANIASRGASLDSVILVTMANGTPIGLPSNGAVIASQVDVVGGVPTVADQRAAGGMTVASQLGGIGQPAGPLVGGGLTTGRSYFVVEVFLPYRPFTPLRGFVNPIIPDTLYDRSVF